MMPITDLIQSGLYSHDEGFILTYVLLGRALWTIEREAEFAFHRVTLTLVCMFSCIPVTYMVGTFIV